MGAGVGIITAALPRRGVAIIDNGHVSQADTVSHGPVSHQHPRLHGGKDNSSAHRSLSTSSPYPSYGSFNSIDGHSRVYSSPERLRRGDSQIILNRVPEDRTMDFEHDEGPRYTIGAPLEEHEREEEEELELDAELAIQGLYRGTFLVFLSSSSAGLYATTGSYPRLMALYTLAPLTWIIIFALMALLPSLVYPIDESIPQTFPYAPYLPFPVPEFLVAVVLWSFAYLIRDPIYSLSAALASPFPSISLTLPLLLSTALHTVLSTLIQQTTIPLLLIPQYQALEYPAAWDPAFRRVWWAALGWSTAEAVVGIKQGYESIALYRDVLVSAYRSSPSRPGTAFAGLRFTLDHNGSNSRSPHTSKSSGAHASLGAGNSDIDILNRDVEDDVYGPRNFYEDGEHDALLPQGPGSARHEFELDDALKSQVDRDIDQLIALKNREELEEIYGIPVIVCLILVGRRIGTNMAMSSGYLFSSHVSNASTPCCCPSAFTLSSPPRTYAPPLPSPRRHEIRQNPTPRCSSPFL